jgi:hypothetical protein
MGHVIENIETPVELVRAFACLFDVSCLIRPTYKRIILHKISVQMKFSVYKEKNSNQSSNNAL